MTKGIPFDYAFGDGGKEHQFCPWASGPSESQTLARTLAALICFCFNRESWWSIGFAGVGVNLDPLGNNPQKL